MNDFTPWLKYPSLQSGRLAAIAEIFRRVRHDAVLLHDPASGDDEWGLGCRVYERSCFAIREAVKTYSWLTILRESEKLAFSFAIGQIPCRFYKGPPDYPPERFANATFGELRHLQACFDIDGLRPLDRILRFAVESDVTREVSTVTLVEVDEARNPTGTYVIPPLGTKLSNVTPLEAKPVELPPVTLEPRMDEEKSGELGKETSERKIRRK